MCLQPAIDHPGQLPPAAECANEPIEPGLKLPPLVLAERQIGILDLPPQERLLLLEHLLASQQVGVGIDGEEAVILWMHRPEPLLEERLGTVHPEDDRLLTVDTYADLLRSQEMFEEEEALLRREIEDADLALSEDERGQLQARLDGLISTLSGRRELTGMIDRWLEAHMPPWWNGARPALSLIHI